MRLLWLPDVLRGAGLSVQTYPGWETRGSANWGPLRGIVCHATAGGRGSSDAGEMRVLWEVGSPTAPTPIAQLYLSRTGTWWVGASGLCYHALIGQRGPHKGYGNSALIGVEAANDNRGEPWPAAQVDAYIRGVAAICRHMGWSADVVVGHREHQTDKSDPYGIDMDDFRRRVAALLADGRGGMGDVATIVYDTDSKAYYVLGSDGVARRLLLRSESGINDVGYVVSGRYSQDMRGRPGQAAPGELPYTNRPIDRAPWIDIPQVRLSVIAVDVPVSGGAGITQTQVEAAAEAAVRKVVGDAFDGGAARARGK